MENKSDYWELIIAEYEERIRILELSVKRYKTLAENCRKAAVEEINRDP